MNNMNMPGAGSDSTGNQGYFQEWDVMRTTLLFRNYIITEPYQFVLTWFLVMFSVVVYYLLRQLLATMDQSMISALGACHGGDKHESSSDMTSMYSTKNLIMKPLKRPVGWRSLKLIHSTIAGVNYGLSLMLMLVAMTFIPSLFLALFIGSVIGEYISCDHHIDLAMGAMRPLSPYVGFVEKMIRFVLCVRNSEKQIDKVEVEDMEEEGKMEVAEEKKRSYELPLIARTVLWLLPRTFSLILMIVTLVWIYRNQNGFGFEPISVFGWHAISMVLFAAVFSNEGMLSYAVPLLPQLMNEPKLSRMFHMICHIGSLTCLIVGLTAVIKMKEWQATEYNKYDVMFTGHSWMGVTTVSLWMLQFIFAVWLRMLTKWPPGTEDRKAVYAEAHRFMGYTVYAMGLASCATGFQDMQSYDAAALISGGGGGHGRRLHNFQVTAGDVNTGFDLSIPQPGDDARLASVGMVLLAAVGISTFAALRYYPLKTTA